MGYYSIVVWWSLIDFQAKERLLTVCENTTWLSLCCQSSFPINFDNHT